MIFLARTTDSVRVITDVESWNDRPQVRPPTLHSVVGIGSTRALSSTAVTHGQFIIQKSSIEEVGQTLEPGELCYLYSRLIPLST